MTAASPAEPSRETGWWYGLVLVSLFLGGIGIAAPAAELILAAGVGVMYAGIARGDADPPSRSALAFERSVDEATVAGEDVRVVVSVRNESDRFVPDLRIVDGVPPALEVTGGTPRCATALRPGEETSFEYTVAAIRGTHEWDPITAAVANRSGSRQQTLSVSIDAAIECRHPSIGTDALPVRGLTTQFAGRIRTDRGGSGTEFYATRSYREGDPLRRIDWRRLARTGELSTIDFHEERGVSVVLLVDARKVAYRAPGPSAPHAVDLSVEAATRIFSSLLHNGHRAGIAVFGPTDAWLSPGAGSDHRARAMELLTNDPSLAQDPPDREPIRDLLSDRQDDLLRERVETLHQRLPGDAQVFCLSPCLDEYIANVADYLDAHGHLVTVVSPNPSVTDTPGHYVAALAREHRLRRLYEFGIPVIDWRADEPLEAALLRAEVVERQ